MDMAVNRQLKHLTALVGIDALLSVATNCPTVCR